MSETLEVKREQVATLGKSYNTVKESQGSSQSKLASAEDLLQTLITGLAGSQAANDTAGGGYMGQIAQAKKRMADAATQEEGAKLRLSMAEKELKEKEAKMKALEKEGGEGQKALARGRQEIDALKKQIAATEWSAEKEDEANRRAGGAREDLKRLSEVCEITGFQSRQADVT